MENREPAPPFFLLILNLYGQQPEFVTGWFCDRWCEMTTYDRNRWIVKNLDELQTMWGELGVLGFGKFGDGLPACLELLDAEMALVVQSNNIFDLPTDQNPDCPTLKDDHE